MSQSLKTHRLSGGGPAWPGFRGTSQFVGSTPDGIVTVYVDPNLGPQGLQNGQDLLADAPRVVAANNAIFGTTGGAVSVIVYALGGATDGSGGADHMGCDYQSGNNVEVCASFGDSTRVSALFEAELSECSMNGQLCGLSTGEALSRWCASSTSNNALADFATAPDWAQSGAPDYVDSVDPTDQDAVSTGCGMAFISWLLSMGYPLAQVAQQMVSDGDGGTLAALYGALTADDPANAWPNFLQAVNALPGGVNTDNPFGSDTSAATATGNDLADLRRRVAALEAEHARLLARGVGVAEGDVTRLRVMSAPAGSGLTADLWHEQFTPAYVGRSVVAIENHLADMERFAAAGDEAAARQSKLAAAMRSCSTLRMLCDDDEFNQMLISMAGHANAESGNVFGHISGNANVPGGFRDIEIQLLQVAGLPEVMARTHVDAAIAAYDEDPTGALVRIQNPMTLLTNLRQLRDASCQSADILSQGIRQQRSRQRWKKLLTFGLGGTLIVAVNGIGTAVLGPVGVAASGAIGSAAVGVAAQILS